MNIIDVLEVLQKSGYKLEGSHFVKEKQYKCLNEKLGLYFIESFASGEPQVESKRYWDALLNGDYSNHKLIEVPFDKLEIDYIVSKYYNTLKKPTNITLHSLGMSGNCPTCDYTVHLIYDECQRCLQKLDWGSKYE